MAINLSGLNGRNVFFWRWFIPHSAYIVKYTDDGKYYAINKRDGKLYVFSQYTKYDTEGKVGTRIEITHVDYRVLNAYNLHITKENWREFIDNNKNCRFSASDILSIIRDIMCILSVLCLILSMFNIEFLNLVIGPWVISPFLTLHLYNEEDVQARSSLSKYLPNQTIDYSIFHKKEKT